MTKHRWTRWWADTLFKRLLLLMWAALVISHLCAFFVVRSYTSATDQEPGRGMPTIPRVMPSLPPGGLFPGGPPDGPPGGAQGRPPGRADAPRSAEPETPPGNELPGAFDGGPPMEPGGMGPRRGLPATALWLDYGVRWLIIGIAAWYGARWLARPMGRLAAASTALAGSLGRRVPRPAPLDEERGTLEVQRTAAVFNAMATRLQQEFDAQNLLLAAISHDLRTPLARLRFRLEEIGAPAERCIADVHEMDRLIASVLEMMRDAQQQTPRQRVELRALVQSLVDDLSDQGRAVQLLGDDGDAPMVVLAQRAALDRILANLVGNALRYGGSAVLSLAARPDGVHLCIDDQGPGIPAEQLDAVFQPFYRVEGSRSRETAGTGLGLHIARDLARRNGGELSVTNRPEGGLRAELVLPLA
jgi:signal transduction histidine kinase